MELNHDACYRALKSRDPRFDGKFFVGVTSTGIYCRPICRVKQPKQENVNFYKSSAAAEQAGFRPCLKCRPEIAPGYSAMDSKESLAQHAMRLLDLLHPAEQGLPDIAAKLGVTDRYMRKIFREKFGVSPIGYLQSKRLLTAKMLLTDSDLSMTAIAGVSGFNSQRRLNTAFKDQYGLSPTALRKQNRSRQKANTFHFSLGYRPPYDYRHLLSFLAQRAISGVERVDEKSYRRSLRITPANNEKTVTGWFAIQFDDKRNLAHVELAAELLPCFQLIQQKICQAFDINHSPNETLMSSGNSTPANNFVWNPGIRIPGCMDFFETGVRAILGQQVSLEQSIKVLTRFVDQFGQTTGFDQADLTLLFPEPQTIAALETGQIAELGLFRQRAEAIQQFARFCTQHDPLTLALDPESTIKQLTSLKGIGNWTAQYIALRGLGWQDVFMPQDAVVKKAANRLAGKDLSPGDLESFAADWQPWRSYLCLNLWDYAVKSAALTA